MRDEKLRVAQLMQLMETKEPLNSLYIIHLKFLVETDMGQILDMLLRLTVVFSCCLHVYLYSNSYLIHLL